MLLCTVYIQRDWIAIVQYLVASLLSWVSFLVGSSVLAPESQYHTALHSVLYQMEKNNSANTHMISHFRRSPASSSVSYPQQVLSSSNPARPRHPAGRPWPLLLQPAGPGARAGPHLHPPHCLRTPAREDRHRVPCRGFHLGLLDPGRTSQQEGQ